MKSYIKIKHEPNSVYVSLIAIIHHVAVIIFDVGSIFGTLGAAKTSSFNSSFIINIIALAI